MSSGTTKAENRQAEKIAANNCRQRQLYFTYMAGAASINNLKNRYQLPPSPYPQYTKTQLDMRRKAEILQYPQQSFVLTKAQTWRKLVQATNRLPCPDNTVKYVPTSSSDVPGPVILLTNDTKIPLYNYVPGINFDNRLSVIAYPTLTQPWSSFPEINKVFSQNTYTTVAGLVIVSPNSNNYNFTMKSSVAISISGQAIIPSPSTITVNSISAYVSSINFEVYYGDILIATNPVITNNFTNLDINVDNTIGQFSATAYVGQLTVSNIKLLTVPQYVYTFKLNFNIGYTEYDVNNNIISTTTPTNISNVTLSTVCNLIDHTDPNYNQATNCTNIFPPNYSKFIPFAISGVISQ